MFKGIELLVGGAFSETSKAPDRKSVRAFIDAKSEIESTWTDLRAAGIHNSNYKTFALVPGLTLHDLAGRFKDARHVWPQTMLKAPNTQLETGFGMEKLCGHFAASLAESQGLLLFLQNLYSLLFTAWNGMHGDVDIRVWAGISGGTGPDVGRHLASRMSDLISSESGQTTTANLIRIGAVSYEGLGDRIWQNASSALFEDLVWVLAPPARAEEIRRLSLVELPTVSTDETQIGTDKATRGSLATQLTQAISSPDVDAIFTSRNPNLDLATNGYGTIRLLQADWWNTIPPLEIAFSAANCYESHLLKAESEAESFADDSLSAPDVRIDVIPDRETPKSAQQTAASVLLEPMPSRGEFETEVRSIRSFNAQAMLEYSEQHSRDSVTEVLANPKSVSQYFNSLRHLSGIVQALDDKLDSCRTEKSDTQIELEQAETELIRAIDTWYPQSMADKLRSTFQSAAGKLSALEQSADKYRRLAESMAQVDTSIKALENLILTERRRLREYRDRPRILKENLSRILVESSQSEKLVHTNRFQFKEIDDVFADLLSMRDDVQALRHWLGCESCKGITSEGLAEIVGVGSLASARQIIAALFDRAPRYRGPNWGGCDPVEEPVETIIVLPQVCPALFTELEKALKVQARSSRSHSLAQLDSFMAGANILVLRLYKVEEPWQVITQRYFHTIRNMDRERYFVDWNGMMDQDRWRKLYESLGHHYRL